MSKTIGILGGMGPEATAHFYSLIIKYTKAEKDQEHIPVIIYSNPKIPPRTDAILERKESPLPYLIEGGNVLRRAGADFIVIPCITAHYYFPQIVARVKVPFLNLLDETMLYIEKEMPHVERAGLIASTGTIESRIFHETFRLAGIEIICPAWSDQKEVMEAIFGKKGIKAGYTSGPAKEAIDYIANTLVDRGAQSVILGCTEFPLVMSDGDIPVPVIDPLKIMAEVSILNAGYELRRNRRL